VKTKDGKSTGEFGNWLDQYLGLNSQYSVYYDHGEKDKYPNVVAVKGIYGQKVSNKNRLVDTDVMVVNNEKNRVILLIEIEESEMSPKKLLGDIFATLMCNQFAVRIGDEQKYFRVSPKTRLIVAGVMQNRGDGQEKIYKTITPRLREFDVPGDAIQIDKINVVLGEDIMEIQEKLKKEMRNFFDLNEQ